MSQNFSRAWTKIKLIKNITSKKTNQKILRTKNVQFFDQKCTFENLMNIYYII